MKIRKFPLLLAIVLMLTFMSVGVSAAEIAHDISDGTVIITDACGEECPGHIITGQVNQEVKNIRITGGSHRIVLKDLGVFTCQSDGRELLESEKMDYAALYMASGVKADITLEGYVSFTCDYGIYAPGAELTIHGDDDSEFQATGKRYGIYAPDAKLTFDGGYYYSGTDGSAGITNRSGIYAGTVTVKNAKLDSISCDVTEGDGCITAGILTKNLIAENSTLKIVAENAPGGTSVGIHATDLFQAENTEIEVQSGDAKESYGIRAGQKLVFEGVDLIVNAGNAEKSSVGMQLLPNTTATINNSYIDTTAGQGNDSYGFFAFDSSDLNPIVVTLTDSSLVAFGGTAEVQSIGLTATDLTATGCYIEVSGGDADVSYGLNAYGYYNKVNDDTGEPESVYFGKVTLTDSQLEAVSGTATEYSAAVDVAFLTVTDSDINAIAGDAESESYGLTANDFTAVNSYITAIGGNVDTDADYSYSDGMYVFNIKGTDSEFFATGGIAVQSEGVYADTILLDGGIIQASADESSEYSYGIYLDDEPSFILIGADVIADGATQNVYVDEDNADEFRGIVYKADENAEPQTVTDLEEFNGYFGNQYKLTYNANGVDAEMPETETYYNGEFIEITEIIPTAEGYTFLGWSEDPDSVSPEHEAGADSSTSMGGEDITLYAIWQCEGGKDCVLHSFDDLNPTAWYHDGIHFCIDAGIMEGMSKTEFGHGLSASRAMIVATLYRLAGKPEVTAENTFTDIPDNKWYTDAVLWAAETGIAEGYPDGSFAPDKAATREELVAILYRYCDASSEQESDIPDEYTDKEKVSGWAAEAMAWAIDNEIIEGTTDTTLAPKASATRAQLAAILQRTIENFIIG